jgi:hypothetical protein
MGRLVITEDEIKKFRSAGLLDETALLHLEIKAAFKELTKKHPDVKKRVHREMLADRYSIAIKTVNSIVYRRSRRKKRFISTLKEVRVKK